MIQPLSLSVVHAVAEEKGIDPIEMTEPLGDVIDTDALNALSESNFEQLSFKYNGYTIFVEGDCSVRVDPLST